MLSSKNDAKQESRFAARLDVLTERVDTLASTVATTASAMAKKEGEIAALRKELAVRDQQLADFVTKARDAGSGGEDLRELKQAVAALTAEQPTKRGGGGSKQLDEVLAKLNLLGQRLDTLSTTVSTTAAGLSGREGELAAIRKQLDAGAGAGGSTSAAVDPELRNQLANVSAATTRLEARLEQQTTQLAGFETRLGERETAPAPAASDELRSMLAMLRTRVESLDALRAGVTEEVLNERLAGTTETVARLSDRLDELATTVDAASARMQEKELELSGLHQTFLESSTRIQTIVVDVREALGALEETDPDALTALSGRVDSTSSEIAAVVARVAELESTRADGDVAGLAKHLDAVDKRLDAIVADVGRAKTLWPVALRSLEARLDDVVAAPRVAEQAADAPASEPAPDDADDLLAELRDSLQVMENVAAEFERAADGHSEPDLLEDDEQQAVAGGARVVPLRTNDS